MCSTTLRMICASATIALAGTALAADMTGAEIKAYLADKTTYAETTTASASGQAGQTIIFWGADGAMLFKAPNGTLMHGKWDIKENTACFDLKEKPGDSCSRYDKQGDAISVFDAKTGALRAKIFKSAPGNAEKLGP